MRNTSEKNLIIEIAMIVLALLSIFLLFFEIALHLSPEQERLIEYLDISIAAAFLLDFLYQFFWAKDKRTFFLEHWWQLLAAIPITNQTTQLLRSVQLLRIIPVLEMLRVARLAVRLRIIVELSRKFSKHAYLVYLAIIVGLVNFAGALSFYRFEAGVNPRVDSLWDGIWWAVVTMTTIGYGDIYPVTTGGRIVAILLMLTGIGTLGAFIATVQTFIINRKLKT